jgi:hypothetical protein
MGTLRGVGVMKCSAEARIHVVAQSGTELETQHSKRPGTSTMIFCRTSNTHPFLCRQFRQRGVLANPRLSWLSVALDIQVTASHSTNCLVFSWYFSKAHARVLDLSHNSLCKTAVYSKAHNLVLPFVLVVSLGSWRPNDIAMACGLSFCTYSVYSLSANLSGIDRHCKGTKEGRGRLMLD